MYLERLSNLAGVSGDEGRVREGILEILRGEIAGDKPLEISCDTMGNLFVRKAGRAAASTPRVMLAAHMDEVGLMVTSVEKGGQLKFKPVGAIDLRVLVSKAVRVGRQGIAGVIGAKAVHLQKPEERKKPFEREQLFIDIGARSKEEAEKQVKIGDFVSFDSSFTALGGDYYRGKAFDDRAGCAVLLELLMGDSSVPFDAAFTVQEEVGSRGALVAAYTLQPGLAVVLEGTSASDTPGTDEDKTATCLGAGPAISFMDRSFIADRALLQELVHVARDQGIPYQFRRFTGGGTDAGAIALSRQGVRTIAVSVPCRYIHSPYSVLKESDLKQTAALVRAWLDSLSK